VQKDSQVIKNLFALLGSWHVKALHKHVGEIDPSSLTSQPQNDFTD